MEKKRRKQTRNSKMDNWWRKQIAEQSGKPLLKRWYFAPAYGMLILSILFAFDRSMWDKSDIDTSLLSDEEKVDIYVKEKIRLKKETNQEYATMLEQYLMEERKNRSNATEKDLSEEERNALKTEAYNRAKNRLRVDTVQKLVKE